MSHLNPNAKSGDFLMRGLKNSTIEKTHLHENYKTGEITSNAPNNIFEQDVTIEGDLIYSNSLPFIETTYTPAYNLMSRSTLKTGRIYYITDIGVYLMAVANNKFSNQGIFKAELPDWQNTTGNFLEIGRAHV